MYIYLVSILFQKNLRDFHRNWLQDQKPIQVQSFLFITSQGATKGETLLHEEKSTGFLKISLEIAPQEKINRFQSQRHITGHPIGSDFCPLCYLTNRRTIRRATREKQKKYKKKFEFSEIVWYSIRVQILTKRRTRFSFDIVCFIILQTIKNILLILLLVTVTPYR